MVVDYVINVGGEAGGYVLEKRKLLMYISYSVIKSKVVSCIEYCKKNLVREEKP